MPPSPKLTPAPEPSAYRDRMIMDELTTLEHEGWRALCGGSGADFYRDLMTPDAVMVLAHGQVLDRAAVAASLAAAPPWGSYEIDGERVIPVSDDAAVLVYRARATRGDEPAFIAWMSSTYVREAPGWRLACYQQTPVPPDPAGSES